MSLAVTSVLGAFLLAQQPAAPDQSWVSIGGNDRVQVAMRLPRIRPDWRGRKMAETTYALARTETVEGLVMDYVTFVSWFDCRRRTIRNVTNMAYELDAPFSHPTFTYNRPPEVEPGTIDDYQLRYVCDGGVVEGERFVTAREFVRRVRNDGFTGPVQP